MAESEDNQRFASAFSVALGAVGPHIEPKLSVPVAISVDGMKDVFRAATEQDVGTFVYGTVADLAARVIAEASFGQLDTFIAEGAETLGTALAPMTEALGALLDVIPVVGQTVGEMIDVIHSYERAERERAIARKRALSMMCASYFDQDVADPTGRSGVTPADMFRDLAEGTGSLTGGWPMSAATAFALLCGDQIRGGVRFPKQAGETYLQSPQQAYAAWLEQARAKYGPQIGIDRETRRTMWLLIEGIMAARRPYTMERVEPIGDQGRVLFPVLCDIVLSEWQDRGTWSVESVQDLFYWCSPTCGQFVDMGELFQQTVMKWKYFIQPASWDGLIQKAQEDAARAGRTKTGLLGISARDAVRLVAKSEQAAAAAPPPSPPLTPLQSLALGTAAVGASYGAWYAMRRWGPGKRARG